LSRRVAGYILQFYDMDDFAAGFFLLRFLASIIKRCYTFVISYLRLYSDRLFHHVYSVTGGYIQYPPICTPVKRDVI